MLDTRSCDDVSWPFGDIPRGQLCLDSDQILQCSEMTRCAKGGHRHQSPLLFSLRETSLTKGEDDPVPPFNVARQEHLGRRLTLMANSLYVGRVVT
jgi:hypothetical protein